MVVEENGLGICALAWRRVIWEVASQLWISWSPFCENQPGVEVGSFLMMVRYGHHTSGQMNTSGDFELGSIECCDWLKCRFIVLWCCSVFSH